MRPSRPDALALAAVAALALLSHAPALRAGFVQDDHLLVESNPIVARGSPAEIATSAYWAGTPSKDRGLWRPVPIASYALERRLGAGPGGAHAVNLLLHAAFAALVFLLGRRVGLGALGAFAAAAIVAVHPGPSEAVYNVVGRAEILAGIGVVGCALAWKGGRPWLAAALALLALASKETGIVACPLAFLLDRRRNPWPLAAAMAGSLVVRFAALGDFAVPPIPAIDNPLVTLPLVPRIAAALSLVPRYALLFLFPRTLACDWSGPSIPLDAWGGAVGGAAILGLVAFLVFDRRRSEAVRAGASLALLPYLVVGNLFLLTGVVYAERLLYLPAAGAALLVAFGLEKLPRRVGAGVLAAALLLLGARTFVRGSDWRDDRTVFEAALRDNPRSPRAPLALAVLLTPEAGPGPEGTAAGERAIALAERSLALWPAQGVPWAQKGLVLAKLGRLDEAEAALREGVRVSPDSAEAHLNLALVLQREGRPGPARGHAEEAARLDPTRDRAFATLGHLAMAEGRYADAAAAYARAVALGREDLAGNLAEARRRAGLPVD